MIKYLTYTNTRKKKGIKYYISGNTLYVGLAFILANTFKDGILSTCSYIQLFNRKYKVVLVDYYKLPHTMLFYHCILYIEYKNKSYITDDLPLNKLTLLKFFGVKL